MELETMTLVYYILLGILAGGSYSLWNYFTKTEPANFEPKRFMASLFFGILIGAVGAYTSSQSGIDPFQVEWWGVMAVLFVTYSGFMVYINRGVDYLFEYLFGAKMGMGNFGSTVRIYPISELAAGIRKMSEESRHFLIFDLPQWAQQPTLVCVDQAESKDPVTYRYAIQAASYIFLIENGQLTGSKRYWFSWSSKIEWKLITYDTLDTIRKTGRFPSYSQLI
jgi:hypothetical protein